ncbi:tyrosine-type recombinase/integrase [Bradyrhizobium canariense]|uniref:Integrase n=1 Tax=Bradyrhizobium canariense TaxID=255045 RepID=A0A1X3FQ51_9BRAD|nr:tyrosine-type recombinase/integrase [Bradyrhizobium canariense]OSI68873.1 integrase [Bradyrhizobium canariense]OSI79414.1 integrase [Bradyrhizobium canariense]OSI89588.1 integrase [Bradyrhizobium canariense]OSI91034.1 integrase [Bradyrhizobium canariense]OSJ03954.1 integrase [Bradyrhizobium canariense]
MPRRSKGARLQLRAARHDRDGNLTHQSTWVIRDGAKYLATGCAQHEVEKAERALKDYISLKYQPKRKERDVELIPIADVLSIFIDDRPDLYIENADAKKYIARMGRLKDFWGKLMLSEVTKAKCNDYVKDRGNKGGSRRDLEDLRAAIEHHADEGFHRGEVRVKLPKKGLPRDRWLERKQAAALIWACWRAREVQTIHRGPDKGQKVETDKRPLRHLARFILIGLYSGTRAGAIASASPIAAIGRSFVDLERGVYYRRREGQAITNKRQPPVPIAPRLLAHLRRWHTRGIIKAHFVEFNGQPVKSVKTAFKSAVRLAKLGTGISPHTLRHTAATWLMQNGCDPWQAAGYLGMSVKMLIEVYGHHHPDHMKDAVTKIAGKPTASASPQKRTAENESNVIRLPAK